MEMVAFISLKCIFYFQDGTTLNLLNYLTNKMYEK